VAALNTRDIDEGWQLDEPSPPAPELESPLEPPSSFTPIRLTADVPLGSRPLPGLPPPPDPQAVLAARVLREAAPGSAEARLAALVFSRIPRRVAVPPSWTRRHRRLATPASNRVVLASLHRFGAVCHIGPPAAKATHADHAAALPPRGRRLGTPVPVPSETDAAERRSFWRRLFVSARKR
jgi:hypothetical protein